MLIGIIVSINTYAQNISRADVDIDRNDHITMFGTTAYRMSENMISEEISGEYYDSDILDDPSIIISLITRDQISYDQNVFINYAIISEIYPDLRSTSPIEFAATGAGQFIVGMNYSGSKWYRGEHKEGILYILRMNKQTLVYTEYKMKTFVGQKEKYVYEESGDGSRAVVFLHSKNGKWYYISQKLNTRIELDKAKSDKIGGTVTRKGNKWGVIDRYGRWIIPCQYDEEIKFIDNLAIVRKDDKWGMINKENKEVIPCQYDEEFYFSEHDLAIVCMNGKWGIIGRDGKVIVNYIYDKKFSFDKKGMAIVYREGKYGVINTENKIIIPCRCDDEIRFINNEALVCMDGKWGCFRIDGKVIAKCVYDEKFSFNEDGIAIVSRNGKYGMINKDNEEIISCQYDQMGGYKYPMIQVKKDGLYGYVYINGIEDYAQCNIVDYQKDKLTLQSTFNIANKECTRFYLKMCSDIPNDPKVELSPICILQIKNTWDTRNCTPFVIEVLDKEAFKKLKKSRSFSNFFLVRITDEQFAKMEMEKRQAKVKEEQELNNKARNIMRSLGVNPGLLF